ncbi:hypothetical protein DFH08DRAFT_811652 [Mycena albidolilacea]|uniref:Uncharacterized protein n=1 Tax=Mycena albidolilacea TaxID=1033008 RepID=A0AAD6ZWR7_9AGAR|nr:hypothetical protein DFH08DRAFT_811652 [Mycena albidolilacea]
MADNGPVLVPLCLETIRIAYLQLGDRVTTALHTQIGDRLRLQEQHSGVLQIMEQGVDTMIQALATATVQSVDLPSEASIPVTYLQHVGGRGRPRITIDYDFLSFGLELRGPTGLAPVAGVSSRTVRRRALDYDLVQPAAPVYTEELDETSGNVICTYTASTSAPVSDITDGELDELVYHILEIFPTFGRRMITGHLRQLHHHVPTLRIREFYERVHGPPCCLLQHAVLRDQTHLRLRFNGRQATQAPRWWRANTGQVWVEEYLKAKTGTSVVGLVSTGDAEDLDAEVAVEVLADTEAIPEGENKHKRRPSMRYADFWRHANDMDKDLILPGI